MSSQAQIAANRQNAHKSTGPQTPEGKAAVAQNALKHGLSATRNVIFTESQQDYDLHQAALLEELAPQGPMEAILADRIISLSWRLKRAEEMQNQTIDAINDKNKCLAFLDTLMPGEKPRDPALTLGRIVYKDFVNYRTLDRLLMYERRIENSLYKTTRQLKTLQKQRKTNQNPLSEQISKIPIPSGINNQSSIINPHSPACHPERSRGTYSNKPAQRLNLNQVPSSLSGDNKIPQNKANLLTRKILPTLAPATNYNQKAPAPNQQEQTQSRRGEATSEPQLVTAKTSDEPELVPA